MGGIPTNWKGQVLNPQKYELQCSPQDYYIDDKIVNGLWAAGEASCASVHGANRLGANSLLDIVVFGKACAENISVQNKPGENIEKYDPGDMENNLCIHNEYKHRKGTVNVGDLREEMQKIMQKHAGVFRSDLLLSEGVKKMQDVYKLFDDTFIEDKSDTFNTEYIELLELKNLLDNSLVTMHSANYRKESRGAHSHQDYPERDDKNWLAHTLAKLDGDLYKREVTRTVLDPMEVEPVPLAKRTY